MAIKQQGFILISLLLLSLIISLLAAESLSQSKLEAYFARNVLENLALKEQAYQSLHKLETQLAKQGFVSPQVQKIAHVANSLNYFDRGGTDIAQIRVNSDAFLLKALWWQRQPDQFEVPKIQRFLAKDGHFYALKVEHKPLSLNLNGTKLLLPKNASQINEPLLVDSKQRHYADQLYVIDNQGQIYFIDLKLAPKDWHLVKIARLSDPPILSVPLWAAFSENDEVELYIATQKGIEVWQFSTKLKRVWKTEVLALSTIFLEGKRLWYVKKGGFDQLKIGALDRLTAKALPTPLFVKAPRQNEYEFSPSQQGSDWKIVPDNLKRIECLYFAGVKILIEPPQYEIGQQRLNFLPLQKGG